MPEPTTQERYEHLRKNAEAFVESLATMVAHLEAQGKDEEASHLRVWALMPWQAALRDDTSGDLWPTCESCGKPIKDEAELFHAEECDLHLGCLG